MKTSDSLSAIAPALVKAQGDVKRATFDKGGHYGKYATLNSVVDAVRPALLAHGLTVIQMPTDIDGNALGVTTRILHESGEWIESTASVQLEAEQRLNIGQVAGKMTTYLKRYMLAGAFLVVADEDTDGETPPPATNGHQRQRVSKPAKAANGKAKAKPTNGTIDWREKVAGHANGIQVSTLGSILANAGFRDNPHHATSSIIKRWPDVEGAGTMLDLDDALAVYDWYANEKQEA